MIDFHQLRTLRSARIRRDIRRDTRRFACAPPTRSFSNSLRENKSRIVVAKKKFSCLVPERFEVPVSKGIPTKQASSPSDVWCWGRRIMVAIPPDRGISFGSKGTLYFFATFELTKKPRRKLHWGAKMPPFWKSKWPCIKRIISRIAGAGGLESGSHYIPGWTPGRVGPGSLAYICQRCFVLTGGRYFI